MNTKKLSDLVNMMDGSVLKFKTPPKSGKGYLIAEIKFGKPYSEFLLDNYVSLINCFQFHIFEEKIYSTLEEAKKYLDALTCDPDRENMRYKIIEVELPSIEDKNE